MNRVSTIASFNLALSNLAETQQRQIVAARQVSSQKLAQDLKGYSGKSETLTAMRAAHSRLQGLLDQNAVLSDRYTTQDVALGQLSDSISGARQAITDTLASGSVDTLMQQMRGYFTDTVASLKSHVWTAPLWQECSGCFASALVRSCVRPVSAALSGRWPWCLS